MNITECELVFSPKNFLKEFDSLQNENNSVYIGFGGNVDTNIFTHKGSKYDSSTESLLNNKALLQIQKKSKPVLYVHTVGNLITLDTATTTYFSLSETIMEDNKAYNYLGSYIGKMEKGFSKPPFEKSLYALFYSILKIVQEDSELSIDQINTQILIKYFNLLDDLFTHNKIDSIKSPYHVIDLIDRSNPEIFSLLNDIESMIQNDIDSYFIDFRRAEQIALEFPATNSDSDSFFRINTVIKSDNHSSFFKFFSRNPLEYPDGKVDSFPCSYFYGKGYHPNTFRHVISVPPKEKYNLKGLTEIIEKMEDEARRRLNMDKRPTDNPRADDSGVPYLYNDPWFDQRQDGYSIIDVPRDGSRLPKDDIIEALWYYGNPLDKAKIQNTSMSIFIPFWNKEKIIGNSWTSNTVDTITKELENVMRNFHPFVNNAIKKNSSVLKTYDYKKSLNINLSPDFGIDLGPAIAVIRQIMLEKISKYIEESNCNLLLKYHQYEHGMCFFELIIEFKYELNEQKISFTEIQWMEHILTLTNFGQLFSKEPDVVNLLKSKTGNSSPLLFPARHFACTTISNIEFKGDRLAEERSIGGALNMMVNDAEPLFKNLPMNNAIKTDNCIEDEITKRHYFGSTSSLLTFDVYANESEHNIANETSKLLFNMVLAQRFVLSQSRMDIIELENNYLNFTKYGFLKWFLRSIVKNDDSEGKDGIEKLRSNIMHMITTSHFNVVSNNRAIQKLFEIISSEMKIKEMYSELQDRTKDLDELVSQKLAKANGMVFIFLTFVLTPIGFGTGLISSLGFDNLNATVNPFSFNETWQFFVMFNIICLLIFGLGGWIMYKRWSSK
tara:strand:+ start:2330 stop:4840 length:2511 start_codon:yes stop_codon:yes gene_type:complete